jgi:hypothetical protein
MEIFNTYKLKLTEEQLFDEIISGNFYIARKGKWVYLVYYDSSDKEIYQLSFHVDGDDINTTNTSRNIEAFQNLTRYRNVNSNLDIDDVFTYDEQYLFENYKQAFKCISEMK